MRAGVYATTCVALVPAMDVEVASVFSSVCAGVYATTCVALVPATDVEVASVLSSVCAGVYATTCVALVPATDVEVASVFSSVFSHWVSSSDVTSVNSRSQSHGLSSCTHTTCSIAAMFPVCTVKSLFVGHFITWIGQSMNLNKIFTFYLAFWCIFEKKMSIIVEP